MSNYIRFDWAIKKLLRQKANFDVLEGFISTLLEKDIKIVTLLESESNRENADEKQNRVDILAQDEKGVKYIIEVQNANETAYFQRILFATSDIVRSYIEKGKGYDNIAKVYSINIVYFDLGRGDDYIYHGFTEFRGIHSNTLLNLSPFQMEVYKANKVSDLFPEYYVLNVSGFDGVATTPIGEWMDFFKNERLADDPKAPGLKKVKEIMQYELMSKEDQAAYDNHLKNIVVLKDNFFTARGEGKMEGRAEGLAEGLAVGREEGIALGRAKGLAEGKKESKIELAKLMLQYDKPLDEIVLFTGLSESEITELRNVEGDD